jgi:hypothetical protein
MDKYLEKAKERYTLLEYKVEVCCICHEIATNSIYDEYDDFASYLCEEHADNYYNLALESYAEELAEADQETHDSIVSILPYLERKKGL